MTARRWLAVVLLLALGRLLHPYLAEVIAVELAVFAATLGAVLWLLATSRGTWAPAPHSRPAFAGGKGGPR